MFTGRYVQLELAATRHIDDVLSAVGSDRSSYEWVDAPRTYDEVCDAIRVNFESPETASKMAFTVRRLTDQQIVGMTHYVSLERWNGPDTSPNLVEIGNTWLNPSALHSPIDTESKLLLMTHAFETWGAERVQIRTDSRNDRSRRALLRIGMQFEGILRSAQPGMGDMGRGTIRDTAVYSVLSSDWPTMKAGLNARL
jgi:N-acetyltransferase